MDSSVYANAFYAFKANTDQQHAEIEWFNSRQTDLLQDNSNISFLSVGCGHGDLEIELLKGLTNSVKNIKFCGVDPNKILLEKFHQRIVTESLKNCEINTIEATFEDFSTTEKFDLILFAHSLYYVQDRFEALKKTLPLIKPGRPIIIMSYTSEGLCDTRRHFLDADSEDRQFVFPYEELIPILDKLPISYKVEVLQTSVDVTHCCDSETPIGKHLLDFLLLADSEVAPKSTTSAMRQYLSEKAIIRKNKKLLPHPTACIVIHAS